MLNTCDDYNYKEKIMKLNSLVRSAIVTGMLVGSSCIFAQADGADTYLREDPNYKPPTSEALYEQTGKRGAPLSFQNQLLSI